jgi:hypothetical protein
MYVDGFLIPVPKKNIATYRKIAKLEGAGRAARGRDQLAQRAPPRPQRFPAQERRQFQAQSREQASDGTSSWTRCARHHRHDRNCCNICCYEGAHSRGVSWST